jgi:hypothetical protein
MSLLLTSLLFTFIDASCPIGVGLRDFNSGPSSATQPCVSDELKMDLSACIYSLLPPESGMEEVFSNVGPEVVDSEKVPSETGLCSLGANPESSAPIPLANEN